MLRTAWFTSLVSTPYSSATSASSITWQSLSTMIFCCTCPKRLAAGKGVVIAENEADAKTDPDMVFDFVTQTGCDLLAVSVGNVHGLDIEPKVDLPLLKTISEISPVPLVMHGGSGIPFETIQAARQYNLLKVNYGSDLRKAFISTFGRAYDKNHNETNVIEYSLQAVENVAEEAAKLVTIINQ